MAKPQVSTPSYQKPKTVPNSTGATDPLRVKGAPVNTNPTRDISAEFMAKKHPTSHCRGK